MKTAIYVRQSVDKKDSISIESQIDFCKKECEGDNTETYQDKGFSGKNTNRPAFEKMMMDVKKGLINKIICYRLDRISRSITDFSSVWEVLKEYNVTFISVNEKFDTSSPVGTAMLYIIMIFAQLERETIAERIKDNYYQRIKKGAWPGGPAPFGFDIIDKKKTGSPICKLVPNDDLNIVKSIFEMYANDDLSLRKVAFKVNEQGFKTFTGGLFSSNTISKILNNPAYVKADADIYNFYKAKHVIIYNEPSEFLGETAGILVGKRKASDRKYTDVSNHLFALSSHQGIVSSDIFLLCQQKLSKNKAIKNTGTSDVTWLSGLLKCGHCGYRLSVQKDKNNYTNLVCTGRTNLGATLCDVRHSEKINTIESIVAKKINEHSLAVVGGSLKNKPSNISNINENSYKLELIEIEEKIQNLISNMANANNIAMNYINTELSRLESTRIELTETLKNCKLNSATKDPVVLIDMNSLSFDGKRKVARDMIDRIDILGDDISIAWQ